MATNVPRWARGRGYRHRRGGVWWTIAMIVLFAGAAVAVALLEPAIPPLAGKATASDGDSFRLGGERVRLLGIDAPELDQTCTRDEMSWACGNEARALMRDLLRGEIDCRPDDRDKYGRVLAYCTSDGEDIGAAMVVAGLALARGDYLAEERAARAAGKGVWSGTFEAPEDWRSNHGEETDGFDLLAWIRTWF